MLSKSFEKKETCAEVPFLLFVQKMQSLGKRHCFRKEVMDSLEKEGQSGCV